MGDAPPQPRPLALKARYVFPVTAEPIADGAVTVQAGRIVAVGDPSPGAELRDLGNVAILPGLVNAHTHLEFSHLTKPLGTTPGDCPNFPAGKMGLSPSQTPSQSGTPFVDWLRAAMAQRPEQPDDSTDAVAMGLRECLRQGVTTLAEIAQPGWSPEPFARTGLAATVFLELIGPTPDRAAAAIESARRHLRTETLPPRCRAGLSPHAPYSVRPDLLASVVALSARTQTPIAFHLAESREELELIRRGTGPLRDMLDELGAEKGTGPICAEHPSGRSGKSDQSPFPPGSRPLDYLRTLSNAHRAVVVHGNYLDADEIAFLARQADRMAVVYCPRTHARFDHAPYPLAEMLRAGAVVALGTDSRASSPDLSLLAEMRFAAHRHRDVAPATVLQLGTIRAAQALGRHHEVGSLESGKTADLAVVALGDHSADDPHKLLLDADHPVIASWLAGAPVTA